MDGVFVEDEVRWINNTNMDGVISWSLEHTKRDGNKGMIRRFLQLLVDAIQWLLLSHSAWMMLNSKSERDEILARY